jgi:poly(3-hydroxybutyrate) depolymerase
MTATATAPRPTTAPPLTRRGGQRERIARLERPLLAVGLALVSLHLLDLAFSGADTSILGVLAIVAVSAAWALAQPHGTRATRLVLAVVIGLLTFGFGVVSHGLHVVNSGPDWTDVTGVGMIAGGLLLVAAGLTAIAAPRRAPRRPALGWRLAHGAGWLAAVPIFAVLAVLPFAIALLTTHAPRWAIQESSLGIPHLEVGIEAADGRELSGWYVPSTNRTGVLLMQGSGGSRERVAAHVRMLARHGYGVLALDNPGNGESEGRSNGLGYNVQPAVDAAVGWLARRHDVDPQRIAGVGTSLGAEVLLEAAAREPRLRAVVADVPARPMDAQRVGDPPLLERVGGGSRRPGHPRHLGHAGGPVAGRDHAQRRAPPGAADRRARRRPGRDPGQSALPRRRRLDRPAVGAPRHRPHRRPAHPSRRVRAPDHRFPRPRARARWVVMTAAHRRLNGASRD